MAKVIVTESYLQNIGSAIRSKLGTQDTYTPAEMAGAIDQIHGNPVLESLNATQNGTYTPSSGKDGFAQAVVNVPNSYAAGDEGKVVSNGALVAQSSTTKNANGTYDTTLNNQVVINVPNSYSASDEGKVVDNGALVSQSSQNITENGTYDTTLKNEVVVNVSGGGGTLISKTITQNGVYDAQDDNADGYDTVTVNVAGSSDPPLPAEYQEVEYISTDGNQWVTVNVENKIGDYVRCWSALSSEAGTAEAGFAGINANVWDLYYDSNQILSYRVQKDLLGTRSIQRDTKTESYVMLNGTNSYFYWGRYRTDAYPFNGRLYKFYLFRPNTTGSNPEMEKICVLIPCYRKSDNVIGVYDVINNAFYINTGTGSFGKGANVAPTQGLIPKNITQNGTYDPLDDNASGYSNVTVNVSGGGLPHGSGEVSVEFNTFYPFETSAEEVIE